MYSSIDARSLRSEEFRSLFDPTQSSSYFAKPSMLIQHTALDTELNKRELSRKHVPYEPTSLFRCLAESLYYTQFQWKRVKSEVLEYLHSLLLPTLKEEVVEDETEKASEHEHPEEASEEKAPDEEAERNGAESETGRNGAESETGRNGTEWDNSAIVVGQVDEQDLSEIAALVSRIDEVKDSLDPGPTFDQSMELLPFLADQYKVKIIVFREDEPDTEPVVFLPRDRVVGVDAISEQLIHRLTVTPSGHFDRVLTFEEVRALSLTQSIMYEHLFTKIFSYPEDVVKRTVKEMLHDKKYSKLRMERKRFARERLSAGDPSPHLPDALAALPPISYKTAKAMDVSVYRNVTMDCWLQKNKERFVAMKVAGLEPNSKCIVTFKPRCLRDRCLRDRCLRDRCLRDSGLRDRCLRDSGVCGCTKSGEVGKKVVGTIVSKNEDNLFQVELLPSGRVVFVGLDQLELLSKRKERQASYFSGSQSRVITSGRSATTETVLEEPVDMTHGGLDTNFPPPFQRNYNTLWLPQTNYLCPQTNYSCPQTNYSCPPAHFQPLYSFPTSGGYGMYGSVPDRFIPSGYQAPFVSPQSQGATMSQSPVFVPQPSVFVPQPPVYVTQPPVFVPQPSMVSCSPLTYADVTASYPTPMVQPIPSVAPQVLVHSGPIWLPASPPLTPFNPPMHPTEAASQGGPSHDPFHFIPSQQ